MHRIPAAVNCQCKAYHFPHRAGGGKCYSSSWAAQFFLNFRQTAICNNCREYQESGCSVADGREDLAQCVGWKNAVHAGQNPINFWRNFV